MCALDSNNENQALNKIHSLNANVLATAKIPIISYGSLQEDYDGIEHVDAELSRMTLHKIEIATKLSLLVNIILFIIKIAVFFRTGSFAVVAAVCSFILYPYIIISVIFK